MKAELTKLVIIILAVLSIFIELKQASFTFSLKAEEPKSFDHSHSIYDSLLKKYVRNGRVDYKGLKTSSEDFDIYLRELGLVNERDYTNWSREEKLAFWINAYNSFTIKAVIDNYPIKGSVFSFYPRNSIRQIDGVWDKIQFRAVSRNVTLEEIEHEILRKQFNEPRIHFAIACASLGCPDLRSEAYMADKINKQLDIATIEFINNPEKGVEINTVNKVVKISKIFKWFGEDFTQGFGNTELFKDRSKEERSVLNFVRNHVESQEERAFLESNQFKISYLNYDWSLNELNLNFG
ncbi:MAG: DUF547 domain-containing protein [Candidatus Dadabacteria bacterium]|nr:DUF547 domain-containing protein [Candidatus Dadabacteria bacterium]